MGNMLDFFRGKPPAGRDARKNTMSVYSVGPVAQRSMGPRPPASPETLSRAAAIYGSAAAVFAVLTVFMFFQGMWFTGLIMILPTFCLAGFSWYYMKP